MTTIVETVVDPAGSPLAGATVEIEVVGPGGQPTVAYTDDDTIIGDHHTTTNTQGVWTADLVPNSMLTPGACLYRITIDHGRPRYLIVPTNSTPLDAADCLTEPPSPATRFGPVTTGDIGETITVRLDGIGTLTDAATVEAHVWTDPDNTTALEATITNPTGRLVTIELGDAEGWLATLDIPAGTTIDYQLRCRVTFTNGDVLTWPTDVIRVTGATA